MISCVSVCVSVSCQCKLKSETEVQVFFGVLQDIFTQFKMGYRMIVLSVVTSLWVFPLLLHAGPITFNDGGYDGVVVAVADNVPAHDCRNVLDKLEVSLFPRNISVRKEEILLAREFLPKSSKSVRMRGEVTVHALRAWGE